MKRLSALLLAMVATAATAAIYPSSDWFGTNVQKQTTAAGVRAALGITSTGGSATNVYFTAGQSTTPRTAGGSNTFDVVGTLTNATTGNAATATLATNLVAGANITNATLSSIDNGILWTNYADAVGAQYDSESAGLIFNTDLYAENIHGGIFSGDGQSLTNIPSLFYSTIAQLTNASPSAGVIAYVDSYHSNWFGGGWFKKEASSATIDNGIVFAAPSGRWRRMYPANWPTNWVNAEWFGLWPNNGANVTWNHADQSAALQAAIDATPLVNGATFTPSFGVTISSPLIISNRSSYFFGGRTPNLASGSRYYPRFDSIINWNGATNVPMLKIHDVGHSTFANFGLDTRVPTSNAAYWSNMATIFMDVDMPAGTTTTTADFFKSIMFRERGTNRSLEGIRIAYTSSANCEFMQFEDCQFTGTGANIPNYWMSVTNVGGLYGVRVGGGGGGANSFEHVMRNCNFYGWQYNIYSDSAGTWDITGNKGTAAGVAAYYLNVTGPSSIRFTRNEGDRQFVVAPSVHPIYLQGNEPAQSYSLSISNIEAVDGVNLILDGNRWNADGSGVTRSVTNSFNATGWYVGRNNRFASSSDALFPAGRFASGFNSVGDFGTTATNAWNAKFPLRTWNDALGAFQNVARFSSYGTPYLELMPEFGQVRVGPGAPSASFSVFDTNSTGVIYRFGDNIKSPRFRGLGNGALSELQTFGNTSAWVETSSTNARIDIVSGNAKNTINFRSGYGEITGTNDVQFAQFGRGGLDYTIKFPYDTNFEVVGPIQGNSVRVTNFFTLFTNDSHAGISTTPTRYGQMTHFDSNGVEHVKVATTSGTLAWASTNIVPLTAAQVVNKFTGTPTGSLFLRDDGTLAAPSVGGVSWGAISGTLSSQTDLENRLVGTTNAGNLAFLDAPNQFSKTNAFDALRATNLNQGVSSVVVGWNSASKLLTTNSVTLPGSKVDLSAYSDTYLLYNNAGGIDVLPQSTFMAANAALAVGTIAGNFNGGVPSAGQVVTVRVPYACTIRSNSIFAWPSGSCVIDVWKHATFDAGATHPVSGDKITASAPPTLSSASAATDATLTGWTTGVSAGDYITFSVTSATTVTNVTVELFITK